MSLAQPDAEFKWLMPHFNVASLKTCFDELDGKKAVGADGTDKEEYRIGLDGRMEDLVGRMKSLSYRPGPVREVLIPKEGRLGETRPLGISNFEDKIVQRMTSKVLGAIYEPLFRNCSFGFRPKRNCHMAVKALNNYLHRNDCAVLIDVDLKNYFGMIDHDKLIGMLRLKIKDETFIRYIVRMLKSGILSDGEFRMTEEGSPQGNVASPILSNIYGHYVIDCWFEDVVKQHCRGRVEIFRYADDLVICCQLKSDSERVLQALEGRLTRFSLKLNRDKTRSVEFNRAAFRQGVKQGTFDFLGFTFYLSYTKTGKVTAKLKTSRKRLRSKLGKVKAWLQANRCRLRLAELWKIFVKKLAGHVQYYGVSHNTEAVSAFIDHATAMFFKWINRRSQRKSITWEKFALLMGRFPKPTAEVLVHLY